MKDSSIIAMMAAVLAGGGLLLASRTATAPVAKGQRSPRPTPTLRSYVRGMAPIARMIEAEGGPPAVFGLAQGAVESNNGSSGLARGSHNHFGIKAGKGWQGDKVILPTREVIDGREVMVNAVFRAYGTDEAGWMDWAKVAARISARGGLSGKDPRDWADAIARGGWATEPKYRDILRRRIDLVEAILADDVSGPRRLSARQIAKIARGAGFSGPQLVTMTAIGLAESDGDPEAEKAGNIGIWQVASDVHKIEPARLKDPIENAIVARGIWKWAARHKPSPYQPWGAFNDGRYLARMDEAQKAVTELST